MDEDNDNYSHVSTEIDDQESEINSQYSGDLKKTEFLITKKSDNGYFKIKQRMNKRDVVTEGYSSSNNPGCYIRNCVTGRYEIDRFGKKIAIVGSKDEELYYKVTLTGNGVGKEPRTLFYQSLSQYERHFKTVVAQNIRDKWNQKQTKNKLRRV